MSMSAKPAITAPTSKKSGVSSQTGTKTQNQQFISMALAMSWQLALVVLVPVVGGAALDKAIGSKSIFTVAGLGLALVGMIFILWRTLQVANSLPVPTLTDAERRKIQKAYDDEDTN